MSATSQKAAGPFTFEVEAKTVEDFLKLLEAREAEHAERTLARRAVYVSPLQHRSHTGYGLPERVRRYVLASFCYGEDLVSYRRDTSYRLETWSSPDSEESGERQRRDFEEIKAELEEAIRALGLSVPILDGAVHAREVRR